MTALKSDLEQRLGTIGARLGIRNFNPKLKKAPERLEHLRMPEGEPIPPNTLAELHRDMARKQLVAGQIREIEKARLEQLEKAPKASAGRQASRRVCFPDIPVVAKEGAAASPTQSTAVRRQSQGVGTGQKATRHFLRSLEGSLRCFVR